MNGAFSILVVDDDPSVVNIISEALGQNGYRQLESIENALIVYQR